MKKPDFPENEAERLAALESFEILDTEPEPDFDALTALASQICGTPIALVSLVDATRQWFKSRHGLGAEQTPREVSFCGHSVASGELLYVPDAHVDERFADNPLVTDDPNVRFYAGAPLTTTEGHTLGTLCVIDHSPRQLSDHQRSQLEMLAQQALRLLELRLRVRQLSEERQRLAEESQRRAELERRNAMFFELHLDLLCIAGFDGFFKQLNPSWSRALGWSDEELMSKPFIEFVHPEDRASTTAEAGKLAGGETTIHFENRYHCRDGSYRWLAWTAAASANEGLIYAAARDVTEWKQVESMKNEFVSIVSHELRTPLTSIRGSLRLLQGGVVGQLEDRAADLVNIACSNTDRLVRLINDMLDLEKIEAGKLELTRTDLDMTAVIDQAIAGTRGFAEEHGIEIVTELGPLVTVRGDSDRLIQVLTNLISNAIKFSPPTGTVKVRGEKRGLRLRVSVEDEGPGIPAEDVERVFGKFEQVDSSDTRKRGGTGLGLAITKALVEEHQGRIGVDSVLGKGSEFWFELPTTALRVTPRPRDSTPGPRRYSVLLVEDDPDIAHVLRLLLSSAGYRVNVAHTRRDAEAMLNLEKPSAIVLDVNLPDGSGLELAEELRERGLDIPVIVTTGCDVVAAEYGDALLVDWLTKPVDEDSLLNALRRAVRSPGPPKVLVVEDDEDAQRVLYHQLQKLGIECAVAHDGRRAIELAREMSPDLIILDVGLPDVDGFDVVDVLKEGTTRTTPLLVYTGRELDSAERSVLHLGLTRHLTKARSSEEDFLHAVTELMNGVLPERSNDG